MIDSYEDFIAFRNRTNNNTDGNGKFYKQTVDITLPNSLTSSWTPIGDDDDYYPFRGHYNGNGKKITNLMKNSYKSSLFGYIDVRVGDYAIKNLSLDYAADPYDDSRTSNLTGALAEELINGTIDNVKVNSTVRNVRSYYDDYNLGGIVGIVRAGSTVKNCVFNGSVSLQHNSSKALTLMAGGVAGLLEGGTIENCLVSADFVSADNTYRYNPEPRAYAGGIVGIVSGDNSKVFNSAFNGKVWSNGYTGGIAGYVIGGTVLSCYVLDGSNVEGKYSAGGIAGYLCNEGVISADKIVMTSTVTASDTALGGIVGEVESGKVMYNWAYTQLSYEAKDGFYTGPIVGRILPGAVAAGKYTVKYNKYLAGVTQTETYEGVEDVISDAAQTLTATEIYPIDPNAGKSTTPTTTTPTTTPDDTTSSTETETTTTETETTTGTENTIDAKAGTLIEVTLDIEEKSEEILKQLSLTDDQQVMELPTDATTARTVEQVSTQESKDIANASQVIVVVLPTIKVNESKVYVWKVNIPATTGLKAGDSINLRLSAGTDADFGISAITATNGILLDDDGNSLKTLPAGGNVNIAAYLEEGKTYSPIITTSSSTATTTGETTDGTSTTASGDSSGDGGGGCEAGSLSGILGLVIMVGALGLKRFN